MRIFIRLWRKLTHVTSLISIFTYTKKETSVLPLRPQRKTIKLSEKGQILSVLTWERKGEKLLLRQDSWYVQYYSPRMSFKFIFEISFSNSILTGSYGWRKRKNLSLSWVSDVWKFLFHIILLSCGE